MQSTLLLQTRCESPSILCIFVVSLALESAVAIFLSDGKNPLLNVAERFSVTPCHPVFFYGGCVD